MSRSIYDTDFTEYLPACLTHDPTMIALAKSVTNELKNVSKDIKNVLIYSRIDELPEALIDILAYDLHVDWYDYSYPLEAKRELIKSSVKVHKKMGTKYAIRKALSALYPQSDVEEWFEYQGEPGHFHIVCDVTNQVVTASVSDIIKAVKMYKRLSAHLDEVVFQSHIHCLIATHTDYYEYTTPMTGRINTGTKPKRNVKGGKNQNITIVGTQAAGFIFTAPQAGTKPHRSTTFRSDVSVIDADTALKTYRYTSAQTGQKKAGEIPRKSISGAKTLSCIDVVDNVSQHIYTTPQTGTKPERSTRLDTKQSALKSSVHVDSYAYHVKKCGSKRKL